MLARGTSQRSKFDLHDEISSMGARYAGHSDREFTRLGLQLHKADAAKGLSILGDMVSNPSINPAELELLKEQVSQEHEDNHNRYSETTIENCHFNSFREHMMGQPIKGDRDLTQSLGADHLRDYHAANFVGKNIVVVATGDVDHAQIVDAVEQSFSSIPLESS
jgi:predicted Zn-dependent peptidase